MPTTRRLVLGTGLAAACLARVRRARAQVPEPITLGVLFPFSGSLSLIGDETFRGLDLATEERNAAGGVLGRRVQFARGDAADTQGGASEATRLLKDAKVPLILGSAASAVGFAASAVTEAAGAFFVELVATADQITERGYQLTFRTGPLASACGALAVETAAQVLAPAWTVAKDALRIAIVHEDGLSGVAFAGAAETRARDLGVGIVERIGYAAAAIDFAPIAQRLRAGNADVVCHAAQVADAVLLPRALAQSGWRPRMLIGAGGGYALADTQQTLGAALDGMMVVDHAPYRISDVVAPGAAGVAAAYQRRYGAAPRSGHSLAAYAGARVVFDAINRAGTLEREGLRAALMRTELPPGATVGGWGVAFGQNGQNLRARPVLAQWQGGTLTTIAPREAALAAARTGLG